MTEFETNYNIFKDNISERDMKEVDRIIKIVTEDDDYMIMPEEVIMSAGFYYSVSKLLENRRVIIVDCGSNIPVWQYFFKRFIGYIAIDNNDTFNLDLKPLNNAEFIKGKIEDVLPKIRQKYGDYDVVVISRLCISYFGGKAEDEFNKFKLKITI